MTTKHNAWIDGLEAGNIFFKWIASFGYAFIILICAVTAIVFWADLALTNDKYFSLALFMIRVIQLGIIMLIFGTALSWICIFLAKIFYQKELKRLYDEGKDKFVKSTSRRQTSSRRIRRK